MTISRVDPIVDATSVAERFNFIASRRALLSWFEQNGRVFPWRETPTPYRVWISEIMLQQTTTQTVVGFFERFLARFPDVDSLARAEESEVLKYWEGLGYYRRARSLHAAARAIVSQHNGVFPDRYEDALALPGIGEYASGAILSFGFDKRAAILEANTTRLHSRLLALREETTKSSARRLLWKFAEDWLPNETSRRLQGLYRRLNGALTDLGRLVCAPTEPLCDKCPLVKYCETYKLGLQETIPVLRKKTETIERTDVAFWISRGDLVETTEKNASDVLLIQRPLGELWAGLWDFPRFETQALDNDRSSFDNADLRDRLQYFLEEKIGAVPFASRPSDILTTIRHSVTKYRVTLFLCRLKGADSQLGVRRSKTLLDLVENVETLPKRKTLEPKENSQSNGLCWRWTPIDELDAIPLSSPGRKLARFIIKATREK